MAEPHWVNRMVGEALHVDQLREHGGLPGLRDEGALESALARPKNKYAYHPDVDVATLAAAYGFGLVKNHAFRDGNKRIGLLTMGVFLGLNGYAFTADDDAVVDAIVSTAAGEWTEARLAKWVRANISREG